MEILQTCWDREVDGIGMWRFYQKMKRLAYTLSALSRNVFGDIFQNVRMNEEDVHKAEENYILHQSEATKSALHEINAKYINFLKLEDTILKQKT